MPETEYLRFQIINHFHGFKQRNWADLSNIANGTYPKVKPCEERLFEKVTWRNYFDIRDYVSGSLDYYDGVTNVNCSFPSKFHSFTHSRYWTCTNMFAEIIDYFLAPKIQKLHLASKVVKVEIPKAEGTIQSTPKLAPEETTFHQF